MCVLCNIQLFDYFVVVFFPQVLNFTNTSAHAQFKISMDGKVSQRSLNLSSSLDEWKETFKEMFSEQCYYGQIDGKFVLRENYIKQRFFLIGRCPTKMFMSLMKILLNHFF